MRFLTLSIGAVLLSACFEVPTSGYDTFEGLEHSRLSDFDLPGYVQYFEIRQGVDPNAWDFEHRMVIQFDPLGHGQLDIGQQLDIDFIDTEQGFAQSCAPSFCPVYIAAVGESVSVIDTEALLKNFLGEIDTAAECALWLMPHELELMESRRFGNGDWDLRVRDSSHRLYRVEMTVHGEILEQRLLEEIPLEYGDFEIGF